MNATATALAPTDEAAFAAAPTQANNTISSMVSARSAQEVQAAMIVAKRFPRDVNAAYQRIMRSCQRTGLAERALYSYPRGNEVVTGPSIRLAEAMAQAWGNCDFGIVELEQRNGESDVMAYAWDLETNTRQTKVFTVKHTRHTKRGVKRLTDPRDIYEMAANQGARRMRACILGIIPGDIQDDAIAQCEQTLHGASNEPIADRIRKMLVAFEAVSVTADMIEARLGHPVDRTSEFELVTLRKMYTALHDGMASRESFFDVTAGQNGAGNGDSLASTLAQKAAEVAGSAQQAPSDGGPTPQDMAPETVHVPADAAKAKNKRRAKSNKTKPPVQLPSDQFTLLRDLVDQVSVDDPDELARLHDSIAFARDNGDITQEQADQLAAEVSAKFQAQAAS